jgi:hypothetical protein
MEVRLPVEASAHGAHEDVPLRMSVHEEKGVREFIKRIGDNFGLHIQIVPSVIPPGARMCRPL